jgi:hypothetical protein
MENRRSPLFITWWIPWFVLAMAKRNAYKEISAWKHRFEPAAIQLDAAFIPEAV